MGFKIIVNDENDKYGTTTKIYWTLSDNAYDVILLDMKDYQRQHFNTEKLTPTKMFNKVFLCFYESAQSSVYRYTEEYKNQMNISTLRKAFYELICDKYLKNKAPRRNFRPSQDTINVLEQCNENAIYCINNKGGSSKKTDKETGVYFRAVLEEYALLPAYERERYLYKDIYTKAKAYHPNKKRVCVTRYDPENGKKITDNLYITHLVVDKNHNHYYVLGVGEPTSKNDEYETYVFRLTTIIEIKENEPLIKKQEDYIEKGREEINEKLKKVDAPYLKDTYYDNIEVKFTANGLNLLRRVIHNRPDYTKDEKRSYVRIFHCTDREIQNYLHNFGEDAVVISPPELRDKLFEFYNNASKSYNNETLCTSEDSCI
jgi:hypothetical protein